jgi:hypothetical protein
VLPIHEKGNEKKEREELDEAHQQLVLYIQTCKGLLLVLLDSCMLILN